VAGVIPIHRRRARRSARHPAHRRVVARRSSQPDPRHCPGGTTQNLGASAIAGCADFSSAVSGSLCWLVRPSSMSVSRDHFRSNTCRSVFVHIPPWLCGPPGAEFGIGITMA
jgi:hypothetical protein